MFHFSNFYLLALSLALLIGGYCTLRPTSDNAHRTLAGKIVLLAALLGAVLRFYGLDFGLPDSYHPDEAKKAHDLANMIKSGTILPYRHLHPPLLLYLTAGMRFLFEQLGIGLDKTIARILLAGRAVSALCGIAAVLLTARIGARLFSPLCGGVAALLLAVTPLHVTCSRYFKEDALVTAMSLACLLFVLRFLDGRRSRDLLIAGFLAGISAGSKYSGVIMVGFVALPLAFSVFETRSLRGTAALLRTTAAALALFPIGFILVAPTVLYFPQGFIAGVLAESNHAMKGHMGARITASSQLWMFHLSKSIIPGMTGVVAFLGLAGCGGILRSRNRKAIVLLLFLLAYYLPSEFAKSKPLPQPDRYVLPCIPILTIAAAETILTIAAFFRSGFLLRWCLVFIVFALPLWRTLDLAGEIRPDTRELMRRWIWRNVPRGTSIALAGGSVYLPRIPLAYKSVTARKLLTEKGADSLTQIADSGLDYLIFSVWDDPRFRKRTRSDRRMMELDKRLTLLKRIAPKYSCYGFHNPTISLYALKPTTGAPRG